MDPIPYADILKSVLKPHVELNPSHGKIETFAVFDDTRNTYCVFDAGWDNGQRVHGLMFAGRISAGQIVIEYDGLHHGVTEQLIEAGVPEQDIIHAWREPCPPEAAPTARPMDSRATTPVSVAH